ncbi:hypothetical protein [Nonlabens ponticola]|uniref:DUF4175 family protein n=1 Tax=Nonlabens ponticola TaxID=2496866 RepID=A0A3S9MVC8_9FLAO|nr:hypothetical protein [Nonlabens ponticola]AZQ43141.1 hypothetical protein EJ995_02410 [Nonlabens ponticola]
MSNFEIIQVKLEKFIGKFYLNDLLRGALLFLAIGLLYFLTTALIEHFLWLSSLGRTILFWLFIIVELALLIKFVFIPLARLLRLARGIDFRDASNIIGNYFPEVSDKLVNVLQLHSSGGDDDLTWASINQKSEELKPIPFSLAIDLGSNKKYLKYLAIPLVIIAAIFFTNNDEMLTSSASRVVDYSNEYIPPAPFTFTVVNGDLSTLQGTNFQLQVNVTGDKLPENASILYDGQEYFMTQISPSSYTFDFERPEDDIDFYIAANDVRSMDYKLQVNSVPTISEFTMMLDYPNYTGKVDEKINGTGNAIIPQGTVVTWNIGALSTQLVQYKSGGDEAINFDKVGDDFAFAKAVLNDLPYTVSTSNENVSGYEQLDFNLEVITDEFPELKVEMKRDSIEERVMYFNGQAADDYGLRSIDLVYFKNDQPQELQLKKIAFSSGAAFHQFLTSFPGDVQLERGHEYSLYFEVVDNDAIHNYKSVKSQTFTFSQPTLPQEQEEQLKNQKQSLSSLEKALEEQKQEQKALENLSQEQIEKRSRSFSDRRKLEQALQKQQQQEKTIQQQLKQLDKQLDKTSEPDERKKQLQERMQESVKQSKKNEELLKQLEEYQDKISKEELQEELQKAQKNTKQQQRSLEQLLELTKRYYVAQKFEQLGKKLQEIAQRQQELSKKSDATNTKEAQEILNEEYKKWEQELRDLEKENEDLKQDMNLDFYPEDGDEIKDEQQQATDDLEKASPKDAQDNQSKAAQLMKKQAAKMQKDMQSMEAEAKEEDAESLRQVLDNLIVFSQEQEDLLDEVKSITANSLSYGKTLRLQKELETVFKHVDDSLFSLSTRNPEVGEKINKEVIDIYYNLEKSLERLGDLDIPAGQVSQQSSLKGANALAAMLSGVLDQLNSPAIPGKPQKGGQGAGFQLPDIIKKQKSLGEKKGEGEKEGDGDGEKPGDGKGDKPGEGKPGNSGAPGQQGESGTSGSGQSHGSQGTSGQGSGQSGENGQAGQSGNPGQAGQGQQGENGQGQGSESQNGTNGSTGQGNGDGNGSGEGLNGDKQSYQESEEESQRIYEIYKQQQELRNQLEDMIIDEGLQQKVDEIRDQMKGVERKLLDQGFNRDVQNEMSEILYDLLKLKDANLEQGKDEQRQSNANQRQYINTASQLDATIQRYFENKEILNRQVLPLQPQYKGKVKSYFKTND